MARAVARVRSSRASHSRADGSAIRMDWVCEAEYIRRNIELSFARFTFNIVLSFCRECSMPFLYSKRGAHRAGI